MSAVQNLFQTLMEKDIVVPYVQNAILSDKWPVEFRIPIKTHGSVEDDYFHPSIDSSSDARYLYYRLHPEERKTLTRQARKKSVENEFSPLMGTIFHVVIQEKLKITGLLKDEHIEVTVTDEEHHGTGHIDFIFPKHPLKGKDIVVDIKTSNPDAFSTMFRPYKSHIYQLQPYMDWYGKQTNQVIDEGVILVVEMGRPFRLKEFRVTRDENILNEVYSKWDFVRECISVNTPPPTKCTGCSLNNEKMNQCPAKNACLKTWESL